MRLRGTTGVPASSTRASAAGALGALRTIAAVAAAVAVAAAAVAVAAFARDGGLIRRTLHARLCGLDGGQRRHPR